MGSCAIGGVSVVSAQARTTKIIVPFAPGIGVDIAARALAEALNRTTGRNFFVDNRAGAGGIVGSTEVSRSNPDGSVLLYTTGGHTTNAVLYKRLPYDSIQDFTPITQITVSGGVALLVGGNSAYKDLGQLLSFAKANPRRITYGSFGVGNTTHLIAELFARAAKIEVVHVPYKGSPLNDLIAGHIDFVMVGVSSAIPYTKDGMARALAVNTAKRSPSLPEVPTLEEFGLLNVDIPAWSGIWGPKGMSAATVQGVYNEIAKAAQLPIFQDAMKLSGTAVLASQPEMFDGVIKKTIAQLHVQLAPLNILMD
jgi:tripartite-type tricarboxylate transporter receptor subunit TctC